MNKIKFYYGRLNAELQKIYSKTYPPFDTKEEAAALIKNICIIYSDVCGEWYRARITDWKLVCLL